MGCHVTVDIDEQFYLAQWVWMLNLFLRPPHPVRLEVCPSKKEEVGRLGIQTCPAPRGVLLHGPPRLNPPTQPAARILPPATATAQISPCPVGHQKIVLIQRDDLENRPATNDQTLIPSTIRVNDRHDGYVTTTIPPQRLLRSLCVRVDWDRGLERVRQRIGSCPLPSLRCYGKNLGSWAEGDGLRSTPPHHHPVSLATARCRALGFLSYLVISALGAERWA